MTEKASFSALVEFDPLVFEQSRIFHASQIQPSLVGSRACRREAEPLSQRRGIDVVLEIGVVERPEHEAISWRSPVIYRDLRIRQC